MAGASMPQPSSSGGKKSVDFQLNLIPFIDLLSVLISFLLMTAVWTQIAKIDVKQSPTMPNDEEPPPEDPEEKLNLTVLVKVSGYSVSTKNTIRKEIEKKGETYDEAGLADILKQIKTESPDNSDINVTCEDKVPYQELIRVMDVALDQKLTGISVAGVDT